MSTPEPGPEAATTVGETEASRSMHEGFVAANQRLAAGGEEGLFNALEYLVQLAVDCLPGCQWATITASPASGRPSSPWASDEIAARVDEIQYALMQGPCLHAAEEDEPVTITDLETDSRWPAFGEAVVAELPVRSTLSFPLGAHPDRMALNFFGSHPRAFDGEQLKDAAVFASQAVTLLLHAETAARAAGLAVAIESNRLIATAIGVLMARRNVTSDAAFDLLKRVSNAKKRKVREIAEYVVEAGELPD